MPARNVLKSYLENGYYHIYNRGVEKRVIFTDKQDESVFLSYLKEYLTLKDTAGLTKVLTNPESSVKQKATRISMYQAHFLWHMQVKTQAEASSLSCTNLSRT